MTVTVAPDLDGCWYPFVEVFTANLAEHHGLTMPEVRQWDFFTAIGWTVTEFKAEITRQIRDCRLFDSAEPYPGSVESSRLLRASGLKIRIQTARVYAGVETEAVEQTMQWLDRYGFVYDTVVVANEKAHTDYAFDDSPHQIAAYLGGGTYCVAVDRPWNRHVTASRASTAYGAAISIIRHATGIGVIE